MICLVTLAQGVHNHTHNIRSTSPLASLWPRCSGRRIPYISTCMEVIGAMTRVSTCASKIEGTRPGIWKTICSAHDIVLELFTWMTSHTWPSCPDSFSNIALKLRWMDVFALSADGKCLFMCRFHESWESPRCILFKCCNLHNLWRDPGGADCPPWGSLVPMHSRKCVIKARTKFS